jgi:hypothetical protein
LRIELTWRLKEKPELCEAEADIGGLEEAAGQGAQEWKACVACVVRGKNIVMMQFVAIEEVVTIRSG